jgi:hypothetical protein
MAHDDGGSACKKLEASGTLSATPSVRDEQRNWLWTLVDDTMRRKPRLTARHFGVTAKHLLVWKSKPRGWRPGFDVLERLVASASFRQMEPWGQARLLREWLRAATEKRTPLSGGVSMAMKWMVDAASEEVLQNLALKLRPADGALD